MTLPLPIIHRVDACRALEVAAEVGGGGEAQLDGCLLHRLLWIGVHDALGLRRHILLDPFQRRHAVAVLAEHLREVPRVVVHQVGIVLDIAVLLVVLHHQVAELLVDHCRPVLRPLLVLLAAVVVDELQAHGQVRLQHLLPQLQVSDVVRSDGLQHLGQRRQANHLHIGQMAHRRVVELVIVMAEG